MAAPTTSVPLGARQALRLAEVYVKAFVVVLLSQLLLAMAATPGIVTLSDARKAAVAAVAAVMQLLLAALGFVNRGGNPGTTSFLPARFDPSTASATPVSPGKEPVIVATPSGPIAISTAKNSEGQEFIDFDASQMGKGHIWLDAAAADQLIAELQAVRGKQ